MSEKILLEFSDERMQDIARASLRAIIRICDSAVEDGDMGRDDLARSVLTLATMGLANYPPLIKDGPLFDDEHPRERP